MRSEWHSQLDHRVSRSTQNKIRILQLSVACLLLGLIFCLVALLRLAHSGVAKTRVCDAKHDTQFLDGVPATFRSVPFTISPADDQPFLFDWHTRKFSSGFDEDRTIWQGRPNDTNNRAWDNLYRNVGITTVDPATAAQLPDTTIEFPGVKDGFVVGIAMFHQLHCLNMIRRAMYPETHMEDVMEHVDHCLDQLRQFVMCSGDLSTVSWEWNREKDVPVSKFGTTRMCRDFDAIHQWASQTALTEARFDQLLRENGHNTVGEAK